MYGMHTSVLQTKFIAIALCMCTWVACKGGTQFTDAGLLPDSEDGSGLDAGSESEPLDWNQVTRDSEASTGNEKEDTYSGFSLVFEPGAQCCSIWQEGRTWVQEMDLLGRIKFIQGVIPIPEDQNEFQIDFIETVEFGPDRRVPISLGSGQVVHSESQNPITQLVEHRYSFEQHFDLNGQDYTVLAQWSFLRDPGQLLLDRLVVDQDFRFFQGQSQLGIQAVIDDGSDPVTQLQEFDNCYYSQLPLWIITADVDNGDRLDLYVRRQIVDAGSAVANLVFGLAIISFESRQVDDYFHLVYAAEHHNWEEKLVVLFEPPIQQSIGGVVLFVSESTVSYLDPQYNVYTQANVANLEIKPAP